MIGVRRSSCFIYVLLEYFLEFVNEKHLGDSIKINMDGVFWLLNIGYISLFSTFVTYFVRDM